MDSYSRRRARAVADQFDADLAVDSLEPAVAPGAPRLRSDPPLRPGLATGRREYRQAIAAPLNIEGYRKLARRKLPRTIFDFIEGGSEDESTVRTNTDAFASLRLRHRMHSSPGSVATAAADVDLSTTLAGQAMSMPVLVSPVNSAMIRPAGNQAAARAATERDLMMVMSGASGYAPEEIARIANGKPWYQLSWFGREFYGELIDRVAAAGFAGLVVLVDTPHPSIRERDIVNGFGWPPRLTRRNVAQFALRPRWTWDVLRHRPVVAKAKPAAARPLCRPTWEDIAWIRERWRGPLAVKGVIDPIDARMAVETGLEVVWVSNHGGRQLDSEQATLEALPGIVEAVGGRAEVVLDGGIRRGTDILKALCLGARAVAIGRAWAYAFAAHGEAGIAHALDILRRELMTSMLLLGVTKIGDLDRSFVLPAGASWQQDTVAKPTPALLSSVGTRGDG
jgi:isopentenyl diphosphate isomerase/L-lactate dehydrogenase-like FMN-dependent dehydrogenase